MATYKVQPQQTIFDIATALYGSMEGIFDLLLSNPDIDMNVDLVPGQELVYHDTYMINRDMATNIKVNGVVPSSGNRMVLPIDMSSVTPCAICKVTAYPSSLTVILKGTGNATMDWGDGTEPQQVVLSASGISITHYFEKNQSDYTVTVFGPITDTEENLGLIYFSASGATGEYYHTSSSVQNTPHHGIIS